MNPFSRGNQRLSYCSGCGADFSEVKRCNGSRCLPCRREYLRARKEKSKALLAASPPRQCRECLEVFDDPARAFTKADVNRCRACLNKRSRELYAANAEQKREGARARRSRDPETHRQYNRSWYYSNPDRARRLARKYYHQSREKNVRRSVEYAKRNREKIRAYRRRNPHIGKASAARRRRLEMEANGSHTAADIKAQHAAQKARCYWCKEKVGDRYQVDHVIPLSKGGSDGRENIVIACPPCNRSKSDKMPEEWAGVLL